MQNAFLSRSRIGDGIYLSVIPSALYKTNYLNLHFLMPQNKDVAAKTAVLSHLITSASEAYPDVRSIRRAQSALYNAQVSAQTSSLGQTQIFTISAVFLKDRFKLSDTENITGQLFSFIREILRKPYLENGGFSEAFCALSINNAVADAQAVLNDKSVYARRRLIETMFCGETFSVDPLGDPKDLRKVNAKELYSFFETMLSEARIEALFAGEADEAALAQSLNACFDGIRREAQTQTDCTPKCARKSVRDLTESMEINQAHLLLGLTTPITRRSCQYAAFIVANTVFGASPTSKLFMNVREKLSLCYRVQSLFDAQKGFLTIYAGIETENRSRAKAEILKQFSEMKNGAFSDEELENAKNVLLNACRSYTESPESAILWALPRIFCGVRVDPEEEMRAVSSVTKDEAQSAFSTLRLDTVYFLSGGAK